MSSIFPSAANSATLGRTDKMDLSIVVATSSAVIGCLLIVARQRSRKVGAVALISFAALRLGPSLSLFLNPGSFGYWYGNLFVSFKGRLNCSAS